MSTVEIISETRCELGEGPLFCQRRNTLFWFDILNRCRYAHNFENGEETCEAFPEIASAMAVVDDNHDLIFTETGLWLRELTTCGWTPICEIEADNEITRSNDARVHPSGAFWLGTMGKSAEAGAGAIYHFRQGTLTKLFDQITIPNAICFAPDGTIAYFTDTMTAKLMQVQTDPDTGLPVAEPTVFYDHTNGEGGLDGAVCDGKGTLWNTRWGASSLDAYNNVGERVETIAIPASQPSCPAFLGDGRIAVTSAWQGMDEAAKSADVNAGKTFVMTLDTPIEPRFEPRVLI